MIGVRQEVAAVVIDENWGIPMERIRQFFARQPDAVQTENGFCCGDCRVTLTPLPGHTVGPWPMPRTRVQIEGTEEAAKALHRKFFLRFLSAGG